MTDPKDTQRTTVEVETESQPDEVEQATTTIETTERETTETTEATEDE